MRYFRSSKNVRQDAAIIAGEMINIMTGKTYYINGVQQEKPIAGHNKYTIDGLEYDIGVVMGHILLLHDTPIELATVVQQILTSVLLSNVYYYGSGWKITNQYVHCESKTEITPSDVNILIDQPYAARYDPLHLFTWYIKSGLQIDLALSTGPHEQGSYHLQAISTIILDNRDLLHIDHGLKQINYPNYKQYAAYRDGRLLSKVINIDPCAGIYFELASLYYKDFSTGGLSTFAYKFDEPVYWIKWSEVKPRCLNYKQLMLQIDTGFKDIEYSTSKNLVCAFSGVPIFDDCYVVDVCGIPGTQFVNPVHLLASPFAIHCLEVCQKLRDNKIAHILYRSKAPVTFETVLSKIDIGAETPIYRRVLMALTKKVTCQCSYSFEITNTRAQSESDLVVLKSQVKSQDLTLGNIICLMKPTIGDKKKFIRWFD